MSTDKIIRILYAAAVGWLCGVAYDGWTGLIVTVSIITAVHIIGILFGNDT